MWLDGLAAVWQSSSCVSSSAVKRSDAAAAVQQVVIAGYDDANHCRQAGKRSADAMYGRWCKHHNHIGCGALCQCMQQHATKLS